MMEQEQRLVEEIQRKYPEACNRFKEAMGDEDYQGELLECWKIWQEDSQGRTFDDILDNGP